jgi:hypothetical protein
MKKWILAFAGVAAVIAIGAGAVMAQTPQAGSGTSFWDRVAQKLGIDTSKLTDAVKSARTDQIDEAVQNGDLTQKQADDLKQRLDQMPDGGPGFPGGPKHGGFPLMGGRGFGFGFPDAAGKLADFLGISQDQLKTELQADNATLATVAEAHGKSRDDLKAFIRDNAKAKLDEAVANGDLTQKREDDALAQLDANLDKIIDGQFGFKGHYFGGPGMHRGPDNDQDDGGATPGAGVEGGLFRS